MPTGGEPTPRVHVCVLLPCPGRLGASPPALVVPGQGLGQGCPLHCRPLSWAVASSHRGGGCGAVASPGVAGVQGSRLGWGVGGAGGAPRTELDGPPAPTLPSTAASPDGHAGHAAASCLLSPVPASRPAPADTLSLLPAPGVMNVWGGGGGRGMRDSSVQEASGPGWKRATSACGRRSRSPPWLRVPACSHAQGPPHPACTGRPTALLRSRHAA